MITLKDYQQRVLDSLRDFLRQCARDRHPSAAFQRTLERNGAQMLPYIPVAASGLAAEMPYVCLRVPTGGGKTLLACHASVLAMSELLRTERAVVLWLVPSNTILEQTADALRDPRHPYRRALELACGAVEVVTIEEALRLSRAAVDGQTVVIVSTIQAFRVEDTTGRKVYEQNGAFSEHLLNLPLDRVNDLLPGADGKPKPSLVNMLRLRRPIVIVDEAHNARTDLSFSTLGQTLPSCIIEFTATPARSNTPSNVLHHVSAAELKAAEMIKLPLRVITRQPSQRNQLLADAITLRGDLEKLANAEGQSTGEYLRPIMLIQAERVDACEPLRERLASEYGIAKEQIKISVGAKDELPSGKEIFSQSCPVRFIITVQKLREGWDCPFAYVLCSLRETRSATAIEQIVGRILRLPGAQTKHHPDLNCAYAFSVSPSIVEVLAELREALEHNGFTTAEAERIIIPVTQGTLPLGAHPKSIQVEPSEIDQAIAEIQVRELGGKARVDSDTGEITVLVPLDKAETEKLASCVKSPEARKKVIEVVDLVREAEKAFGGNGKTRPPSPYEQQLDFFVPVLCVQENGTLFEFDKTFLIEHEWKLSDKEASLAEYYNPLKRPGSNSGTVDVGAKGEVKIAENDHDNDFVATLHQRVFQLSGGGDWTMDKLIAWLDRHIEHKDIPAGESAEFLRKVLHGLMAKFGIADLSVLALDRFRLRDEVERRIEQHRATEHKATFQMYLLEEARLVVTNERGINFKTMLYEPSWLYEGGYQFKKHYFGVKPGELREKTPSGDLTEEFKCAQFIDTLPQVKFWVRNLVRKPSSFRLQTSTDWFYPDFISQLTDGRVVIIEYKGKIYYDSPDSEEKRAIGAVWSSRSRGNCYFDMPTDANFTSLVKLVQG